jgi:hypothetical protein
MTRSPETWQPQQPEATTSPPEIRLGQRFPAFPVAHTSVIPRLPAWGYDGIPRYEAQAMLHTDFLPPMTVTFSAFPTWKHYSQAFTPVTPERGYQFTPEDYEPRTRQQKLAPMLIDQAEDISDNPMLLSADIGYEDIKTLGLHHQPHGLPCFRPEVAEQLQRLRLQLVFRSDETSQRYEAAPDHPLTVEQSVSFFQGFYPIDFGPLPVPSGYEWDLSAGIQIATPSDAELLGQIEGRFLLAGQPQEGH